MIYEMATAWLYAYSSDARTQQDTHHTVFVSGPRQPPENGQYVLAQTCLSYLTTLSGEGAGTAIFSYTPPFGPDAEFHDFKYNSMWIDQCLAVTFMLNAVGAEAYALATIFIFE